MLHHVGRLHHLHLEVLLLLLLLLLLLVLRIVEQKSADAPSDGETLMVACRKRRSEYRVAVVTAEEAVADGVQERLQALLWSGGEA